MLWRLLGWSAVRAQSAVGSVAISEHQQPQAPWGVICVRRGREPAVGFVYRT